MPFRPLTVEELAEEEEKIRVLENTKSLYEDDIDYHRGIIKGGKWYLDSEGEQHG